MVRSSATNHIGLALAAHVGTSKRKPFRWQVAG